VSKATTASLTGLSSCSSITCPEIVIVWENETLLIKVMRTAMDIFFMKSFEIIENQIIKVMHLNFAIVIL
jgi:hypothetical protein